MDCSSKLNITGEVSDDDNADNEWMQEMKQWEL